MNASRGGVSKVYLLVFTESERSVPTSKAGSARWRLKNKNNNNVGAFSFVLAALWLN